MTQPSPKPPKPLSEKLTDALIKLLATGSGGSSLFFLFKNDIPKALIAGAIAAGAALLSSFGESLMKVLKKYMGKKGELAGHAITKKADQALDSLSGFQDKYYQRLIYACRDYRTQGLKTKGPFVLDLEKVFVPLRVLPESAERISSEMIRSGGRTSGLSIWDFLEASRDHQPTYPSMAILGAPGSGKTTLLEHLTLIYAERRQPQSAPTLIPILIYLRDVWDAIASGSLNLATLIEQQESIKKLEPPSQWFENKLRDQQCLVMLDGLDEVADETQRKRVSRWVSQQIQDYPHARFILTSRPFGFKNAPVERVAVVLEVQPFNLNQMQQFIHSWYLQGEIMRRLGRDDPGVREAAQNQADDLIKRIKNSPPLAAMALNPLLLTMIATVHCYRGALPGRRVELYAEICDVLLGRRREAKGILVVSPLTADQKKAVLQVLALELMKLNTREFTPQKGSSLIKDKLVKVAGTEANPEAFLKQVEKESGLLVERESGFYEFAHKSFQEYLAAVQIKESSQEQILTERITDAWWDETIRLYTAQSDATNLIRAALEHPDQNITSLKLALDCSEEGLSVEPEVREQLTDKLEAGLESSNPEISSLAAQVKLARRLSRLLRIDENLEIDQSYITCAEYQLFVDEQLNSQERFQPESAKQPITGISFENALGFCAWLSSKAPLLITSRDKNDAVYYYRLPNLAEAQNYPAKEYEHLGCWTIGESNTKEKGMRVVKTQTPSLFDFDVVTVNAKGQEVQRERRHAPYFTSDLGNGLTLDMVYIPEGTFTMGLPPEEKDSDDDERPQHQVTVQPFFMGTFQVTQAQWRAIAALPKVNRDLKRDPSRFKGDDRPVEKVSWYDAVEFCARLSKMTGRDYRLPSEAEWEYACRAGTTTPFHFGETITTDLANYNASETYANEPKGEHRGETTSVGSFSPNAFGLYDMHCLVWEWCLDPWHNNYKGAPGDGSVWDEKNRNDNYSQNISEHIEVFLKDKRNRIIRGGSWLIDPRHCRSAIRFSDSPRVDDNNSGFRVVCGVPRT
ncbi:MAG: SUMF1/EgtB/PvdO family nonheme iron enzyme [Xenococcaceae cyanobacterium]